MCVWLTFIHIHVCVTFYHHRPRSVEFIRKPVLSAMGLLSLLGSHQVHATVLQSMYDYTFNISCKYLGAYSWTCLKRTPLGPAILSTIWSCPQFRALNFMCAQLISCSRHLVKPDRIKRPGLNLQYICNNYSPPNADTPIVCISDTLPEPNRPKNVQFYLSTVYSAKKVVLQTEYFLQKFTIRTPNFNGQVSGIQHYYHQLHLSLVLDVKKWWI